MKTPYRLLTGLLFLSFICLAGCGDSQQFTDEDLEIMKREQSGPAEGMPEVGQDGYVVGDESAPRLEPTGNGPPKRSDDF